MEKDTARIFRAIGRYGMLSAAALLLVLLFRTIAPANQTTVALTFLVLVLVTASRWRLTYSIYASILCTLLYNFFFLPPVGGLTIADPRNWVALAAFLCSSFLVSHLSEREHQSTESSEARRREVERLYEFSQQLLLQEDLKALERATPSLAARVFGFRAVALYLREDDVAYYSDPENALLPIVDLKLAANQSDAGISVRDGFCLIPLSLGMRSLGALAIADDGFPTQTYEAIGGLIAIALERAAALERSSHLEAERESERLRSALLDSITHDLRTPLTAIRAAATALVSQPDLPEPDRLELATVVDEESARLNRLIGQAVEMAQLDLDALQVQSCPQDVRELIETTVEEMHPFLRGHSVDIEIADSLPLVPMDRVLVNRVLRHLLENAAKYSPADLPISVYAACERDRLLVSVADRGPGIDVEEQQFVFDKYFRGKRAQKVSGTGMGLAIARAILLAHGGGIELSSRPGEGSKFTFWLPLMRTNAASTERPESR